MTVVASAPTYRERLRIEGATLAAVGAVASAVLVARVPASRRWPLNTVAQLGVTAAVLSTRGRAQVRRTLDEAQPLEPGDPGTGEPTPLWMLPAIVGGLAGVFVALPRTGLPLSDRAGWDAGLRVTAGSALSGLAQAVAFERLVAEDEARRGRRYVRAAGSTLLGGTRLGYLPAR